jgi:hypothetical protein
MGVEPKKTNKPIAKLLHAAGLDLDAATRLLADPPNVLAANHLQQAAEKILSAVRLLVYPTRDARPITLRQLAQHTSGLPRDGAFEVQQNPDEATVVGSLAKITLDRAPGLESVYSNLGFGLLGSP